MSEFRNGLLRVASITSVAAFAVSCSSTNHSKASEPAPASVTASPQTPEQAFAQAHCQNLVVGIKGSRLTLAMTGFAKVPADYAVIITKNPNSATASSDYIPLKTLSPDQTQRILAKNVALPDQATATQYEVDGIVKPTGYAGQLATTAGCVYTFAYPPDTTAGPANS